jgi:ribosomal protein S18 acetylase RimI-like enzyme
MAEILGRTSRYFKDKQISPKTSLQLYVTWIENSIFNGYANQCVLLMKDNRLAGIHTMKLKNGTGVVDLIGLGKDFQNMGFGKTLLEEGIKWMQKQDVDTIEVITEAENIPATAFYQKNGFIMKDIELVYHKHF